MVRGLTPAIPPNEFLTPINSKRLIKPRNAKGFKTTNIVTDHARNNSQSYRVDPTKIAVYRCEVVKTCALGLRASCSSLISLIVSEDVS